jgi:ribosomal protein S18 acetylase RimI-like enzyme
MQENDLVILRTRDAMPFDERNGFKVIPAGTLTYWASEVGAGFEAGNSDYHLELNLDESSLAYFSDVLRDSFSNYKNHYDFNPALNGPSTSEAYLQWAMSRVDSEALTGLLTFQEAPIGVVSAVQRDDLVEVEIAGIAPSAQGHGHYKYLLGQLWRMVDQPNSARLVISTQVENRNVQSAWQKMGLNPQFEVHTTHIMRKK